MTKKQKQNLFKWVFVGVVALVVWIIGFYNVNITAETTEFIVKQNEWTTKLIDGFSANAPFYIFVVALLLGGYFFLSKKK